MILLSRPAVGMGNIFTDFWNPNVKTSDWAANLYGWLQYGDVPPLVEPAAGETPQQIAERQRAAIAKAQKDGTWTPDPQMGVTAEDVADAVEKAKKAAETYKWALLGGALLLGYVALRVAMPRRG